MLLSEKTVYIQRYMTRLYIWLVLRKPEYIYTKRQQLISTDNYSGVCVISKYQQTTSELLLVIIVLNTGLETGQSVLLITNIAVVCLQ